MLLSRPIALRPMISNLKLYLPSLWRKYVSAVATPEDLEFNWFICGKPYRDEKTKLDVVKLPPGTKFFSESTGDSYLLVEESVILVVRDIIFPGGLEETVRKYKYAGAAEFVQGCSSKQTGCICDEVSFSFLGEVLKQDTSGECGIVQYAKKYNYQIRQRNPSFPTVEAIDLALANPGKCGDVCKKIQSALRSGELG